jgi:hypothetical protein
MMRELLTRLAETDYHVFRSEDGVEVVSIRAPGSSGEPLLFAVHRMPVATEENSA